MEITNQSLLNRYLFGADPFDDQNCRNCFYFPICGGGCPHKRIENKFSNQEFNFCTYFKGKIDDYLILRSQLIQQKTNI